VVLDVAATYPLAETAAALRLFGTGEAGGKIVVTI
jgi:NADPH:quinone reductase-like Zn-dependent oxidoreductase